MQADCHKNVATVEEQQQNEEAIERYIWFVKPYMASLKRITTCYCIFASVILDVWWNRYGFFTIHTHLCKVDGDDWRTLLRNIGTASSVFGMLHVKTKSSEANENLSTRYKSTGNIQDTLQEKRQVESLGKTSHKDIWAEQKNSWADADGSQSKKHRLARSWLCQQKMKLEKEQIQVWGKENQKQQLQNKSWKGMVTNLKEPRRSTIEWDTQWQSSPWKYLLDCFRNSWFMTIFVTRNGKHYHTRGGD